MNTNLLSGKLVVVVGGAGLLGQSFSHAMASHGATTVIADIDQNHASVACRNIQKRVANADLFAEMVDITDKESLQSLISRVATMGRIDAVVNNAYPRNKHYGRKLPEVTYADFCENLNLHLGGYFLSTQQFSEYFLKQNHGHVINISSVYGVIPPRFDVYEGTSMTMPVEYAAIKSALQHLSLYFMRYYKGTALRFNVVSPGGIFDRQPEAFLERYKRYAQNKGMLSPDDIAGTLVYLISDLSSCVNGQNIVVDDGWSK